MTDEKKILILSYFFYFTMSCKRPIINPIPLNNKVFPLFIYPCFGQKVPTAILMSVVIEKFYKTKSSLHIIKMQGTW